MIEKNYYHMYAVQGEVVWPDTNDYNPIKDLETLTKDIKNSIDIGSKYNYNPIVSYEDYKKRRRYMYKTIQEYINDALDTWHGGKDLENPALKFFGENGELTDYIAKWLYKPGFQLDQEHIIAELGDAWYYWRILVNNLGLSKSIQSVINDMNINDLYTENLRLSDCLAEMGCAAGEILYSIIRQKSEDMRDHNLENLITWFIYFIEALHNLDITLDRIHDYNVIKLNKNKNHGWKPQQG